MSYLVPPPLPAPVIVTKDFGGLVTEYQARTEEYRAANREVRIHECHSACTLALSLPNVCVYPDSVFKFHQAYDLRNHVTDEHVSAELFNSYPDAVRARLGTLTRQFKILSGAELIQLGIRDCNEPRIMVASAGKTVQRPLDQESSLSSIVHGWMGTMTGALTQQPAAAPGAQSQVPVQAASREPSKPAPSDVVFAVFPLPPARPADLNGATQDNKLETALAEARPANAPSVNVTFANVPLPPPRPASLTLAYTQRLPILARPRIIAGAAPILPGNRFVSLAAITR